MIIQIKGRVRSKNVYTFLFYILSNVNKVCELNFLNIDKNIRYFIKLSVFRFHLNNSFELRLRIIKKVK